MKPKVKAQDVQLPHSKAKVDFYLEYLKRYLQVLMRAEFCKKINIYDAFCGRGVYDDGNTGSAIGAFRTICGLVAANPKSTTPIVLHLNDGNIRFITNVKAILGGESCPDNLSVEYSGEDADHLLKELPKTLDNTPKDVRNLLFIDPYGYKHIRKGCLIDLMKNGKTEIILFLPVSMMQRFTQHAMSEPETVQHKHLAEFVDSFFGEDHPIKKAKISQLEYVQHIADSMKCAGKYYATSFFLERDENRYFAVFFLCTHSKGFEKILEVKWGLDEDNGQGFSLPDSQGNLFADMERDENRRNHSERLGAALKAALASSKTNVELREIILRAEYLPKHATEILKDWQAEGHLVVERIDDKSPARRGSFYLGEGTPRVKFTYNGGAT